MSDNSSGNLTTCRFFGFFTVLLILTLDASNGKDMLDVLVPYIESLTTANTNNRN